MSSDFEIHSNDSFSCSQDEPVVIWPEDIVPPKELSVNDKRSLEIANSVRRYCIEWPLKHPTY